MLVPLDGSELSGATLSCAANLSEQLGLSIILVTVVDPDDQDGQMEVFGSENGAFQDNFNLKAEISARLEKTANQLQQERQIPTRSIIAQDDPADEIIHGSVTDAAVRASRDPVLVLPSEPSA
jgi:nucleotide-binding universal stress UspA family protein